VTIELVPSWYNISCVCLMLESASGTFDGEKLKRCNRSTDE